MLPRAFLNQLTPDIDFTGEAVVQCDNAVVKIPFLGGIGLEMIVTKLWWEYLMNSFWTQFCV